MQDAVPLTEKDVLSYGQILGKLKLLIDHRDTAVEGISRFFEDFDCAINFYGTGVGEIDSGEYFHQCGFSGAVFAAEGVYGSLSDRERDIGKRMDRAEALRDAVHFQCIFAHKFFIPEKFSLGSQERLHFRLVHIIFCYECNTCVDFLFNCPALDIHGDSFHALISHLVGVLDYE